MVLLLNFAHPLTEEQMQQLAALLGETPTVQVIPTQADRSRPLSQAAADLAAAAGLSALEWQTLALVVNPPGLAPLAVTLMAEIHGRCGYFPLLVNIRPVAASLPARYEVAEVVNLQQVRDQARTRRF